MSPLKIILLMNLHTTSYPLKDYPREQVMAPAMYEAFEDFRNLGLINQDVTLAAVFSDQPRLDILTDKGINLFERLRGVEP